MEDSTLYRFLKCETSPEEEKTIADWIEADVKNRRRLDVMQLTLEGVALVEPVAASGAVRRFPPLKRLAITAGAAAACVALTLAAGRFMAERKLEQWTQQRTAFSVPAGQQVNVTLPDGTSVWLNSRSKIEYPSIFTGDARRVSIEGEAVFDVTPDPERPFVVETFACDVEVLGTRFDVTAEKERNYFSAAVFSGRVQVTDRSYRDRKTILVRGQNVTLENGRLIGRFFDSAEGYLWTDGIISVKGLSFEQLMRRFERDFGVKILIDCEKTPAIDFNYGKIRISDGVDSALRLLQTQHRFDYTRNDTDGTITIR